MKAQWFYNKASGLNKDLERHRAKEIELKEKLNELYGKVSGAVSYTHLTLPTIYSV